MQKTHIIYFISFFILSFTTIISAFSQNNVLNLEACTLDCEKNFNLLTQNSGRFNIKIINSSGRIMAMPFFNKKFEAKDKMTFDVDIKHWKPGNYLLVIENDIGRKTTQKIKIKAKSI